MDLVLLKECQPVVYASRAQIETEQCHSNIERVHHHTFEYSIMVETDHQPLSIWKKTIATVHVRLQRLLLRLPQYNVDIKYLRGTSTINKQWKDICTLGPQNSTWEDYKSYMRQPRVIQLQRWNHRRRWNFVGEDYSLSSKSVITALKQIFTEIGVPQAKVSDRASQFTSQDFKDFTKTWKIYYRLSSPYKSFCNAIGLCLCAMYQMTSFKTNFDITSFKNI